MNTVAEYRAQHPQPLRQVSLVFLVQPGEVLLAMKKRGFGVGRWNGTGGKPEAGEKLEACAVRETEEEIGVTPRKLERRAVLDFCFPHQPGWSQQVIVYFASEWEGEPQETEEMRPQWFSVSELPFGEMWPDDSLWLPRALAGESLQAEFLFGEGDLVLDYKVSGPQIDSRSSAC